MDSRFFLAWEWWNSYSKVQLKTLVLERGLKWEVDSVLLIRLSVSIDRPGVSIALVNDQQKIYLNAIGYQNLRTKDSLSTRTLISLISLSKIFTALAGANSGVVL